MRTAAVSLVGLGVGSPGPLGPPPAGAQASAARGADHRRAAPGLDLTATPASATAAVVFYNIQEALVKVDAQGRLVPWLAERWHTTDNLNYTFFLKKGVRFHNGRALTAEDVKFVLDRARNPETKHPHARQYEDIATIHVGDPHTVTITLKRPNAMFIYNLARQGSVIYPREAVDQQKSQPIGTGPFMLERWDRGDRIVLKRNPDYHVKGLPKLERVTFRFIPDANAALAALQAGDIDVMAFGLGPESVEVVRRDPTLQLDPGRDDERRDPGAEQLEEAVLRRPGPARDHPRHRQAGGREGRDVRVRADPGVERRSAQPLLRGHGKAVPHDLGSAPSSSWRRQGTRTASRPSSGSRRSTRTRSGPARCWSGSSPKAGIRVKLEQIEWGQWIDRVFQNADYDMTIIGHAEAWDAGNYANPKYYYRYDSPRFQEVFRESETTLDDTKRRELYAQIQKIMADEAPVVWLYAYPRLVAAKKGVQGIWKDLPTPSMDLSEVGWAK